MEGHDAFDIAGRGQDDLVERARPEAAAEPGAGLTITGFLGNSDRPGYRRLYIDRRLERFVEFPIEDVVGGAEIPADQPPFLGERATSVRLRRGARFDVARTVTTEAFDLQPRVHDTMAASIADGFILTEFSEDCYSRRLRCTGPYCNEVEGPVIVYPWPGIR